MGTLQSLHVKRISSHEEEFFYIHIQINSGDALPIFLTNLLLCLRPPRNLNYFMDPFPLQLVIIATITMTVFLRTRMSVDIIHANYYLGSLFYALIILLVNGFPELSMTVSRLAVFYKQRDLCFYPAWAYTIPATILKVPISLVESLVWTSLTYYVIGYSPEFGR